MINLSNLEDSMKIKQLIIISCTPFFLTAGQAQQVQMTFKVMAEYGAPIENATVSMTTLVRHEKGEGFGRDVHSSITAVTDTNGMATLYASTTSPIVGYGVRPLSGYYKTSGGEYIFKAAKDGHWQPQSPIVEMVLRPILDPVPMYAKRVDTHIKKPSLKYSYDLMAGDWVAPEGKGQTADLFFEVDGYWKTNNDYDSTLTISFANPMDGIQPFTTVEGSEFLSPRESPIDGYQDKIELRRVRKPGQLSPAWIDDNQKRTNYFFRVRTVLDENGTIKSALYGKIYGGFKFGGAADNCYLTGDYYLNSELNSRNMEFDPKRNLFKDLKPMESVSAP
jgi:hypothetical protein